VTANLVRIIAPLIVNMSQTIVRLLSRGCCTAVRE
jgi:hypothetical protein